MSLYVSHCLCFYTFQKNAMIDNLQEQVNNAKDKLLRLMSTSQASEDQDMDSSATNLNSSSTQTTELQSEGLSPTSLSQRDTKCRQSTSLLTAAAPAMTPSSLSNPVPISVTSSLPDDARQSQTQRDVSAADSTARDTTGEDSEQPKSVPFPGLPRTAEETVHFVTSLQSRRGLTPSQIETFGSHSGLTFISSEQLQEILQELSVDTVTESTLQSPGQTSSQLKSIKASSTLSPLSLRTPCSPQPPPLLFRYPSISPYTMRKRRPPFHSSRRGLSPPCFYMGSEIPTCRKSGDNCKHQNPGKRSEGVDDTRLPVYSSGVGAEKEEEDAERQVVRRCASGCHRCSAFHCAEQNHTAACDLDVGGDNKQHIRDSCGYCDSDSSSSTDYCYYHRPYCDACLQRGSLLSSDSSSDSSDSEYDSYAGLYRSPRPVVFKEDLKPTFV